MFNKLNSFKTCWGFGVKEVEVTLVLTSNWVSLRLRKKTFPNKLTFCNFLHASLFLRLYLNIKQKYGTTEEFKPFISSWWSCSELREQTSQKITDRKFITSMAIKTTTTITTKDRRSLFDGQNRLFSVLYFPVFYFHFIKAGHCKQKDTLQLDLI